MDLNNPRYYFNRELSWLEFNERVLEEALDKSNPLLERLKFLAISASNLDEFFMVRVAGLMDQVVAEFKGKDMAGYTSTEQLKEISKKVHAMVTKQYKCLKSVLPALEKHNAYFIKFDKLNAKQLEFVEKYFETTIYPIVTPMAIDQSRPLPLLVNKSINLIIELLDKDNPKEPDFAVVPVPTVIPRIISLPSSDDKKQFILLEDIIKEYIDRLFCGHKVLHSYCFRVTRDSDLTLEEEDVADLLSEIEESIKRRKWGDPVRLEIEQNMVKSCRKFLESRLELDDEDIYEIPSILDLTVWMGFSSRKEYSHLNHTPLPPQPCVEFMDRDVFEAIRENDILVHHPYESFDSVMNFVQTAATDPKVLAIKQTLYRVSGNSPIVQALIKAAENGKQVTVLVELKARFDEENNILWAKKLEKAGCHVIYGLVGLKIHSKICLVVRNDDDGIRRYIHLGTGNYNDSTAKIYTDLGFFTCKESFGKDISTLFNLLTGYSANMDWNKISVAPATMRKTLMKLIENEMKNAQAGKPAGITAKMNAIGDQEIIKALYKASMAGVKIKLIVRGICCLKAGIEGISDNITVVSIVDRFLEHSRILCFENEGNPKIYLSSADWRARNLDRRVEVAFPIESPPLKQRLIDLLNYTLQDTVKLRVQQPDGSYSRVDRRGKESLHSQLLFYELAQKRVAKNKEEKKPEMFRPIME